MAYNPREDFGLGFTPNAATIRIGGQPGMMARQPYRPQPYVPASLPGVSADDRKQAFYQGLLALAPRLLAAGAPTTDPGGGQRMLAQAGSAFTGATGDYLKDIRGQNYRKYMMDRQNKADAAAWEEAQWKLHQRPMTTRLLEAQIKQAERPDSSEYGRTIPFPENVEAQRTRMKRVSTPSAMQKNYEFAVVNGYRGTFMDYVMSVSTARGGAIYTPPIRGAVPSGAVPPSARPMVPPSARPMGPPSAVGTIQPIPGSPAAISQAQQRTREIEQQLRIDKIARKAKQRQESRSRAGGTVIQDIGRALAIVEKPGWLSASGIIGGFTEDYPKFKEYFPAAEAKGHIESALSNVGLDTLQAMREGSETGGALGQVPIQQQKRLEQVLGSLDLSQRKEVISDNLKRVHNIYMDIVHGSPEQIRKLLADKKISKERAVQLSERYELSFDEFGRPIPIPPAPMGMNKDEWPEIWRRMPPKDKRLFRKGK